MILLTRALLCKNINCKSHYSSMEYFNDLTISSIQLAYQTVLSALPYCIYATYHFLQINLCALFMANLLRRFCCVTIRLLCG